MQYIVAAAILVACYFLWGWVAVFIAAIAMLVALPVIVLTIGATLWRKESKAFDERAKRHRGGMNGW